MNAFQFLESAGVIRRVRVETMRVEHQHLDVREITDTVYEQLSPLRSLCDQVEHGLWKVDSNR